MEIRVRHPPTPTHLQCIFDPRTSPTCPLQYAPHTALAPRRGVHLQPAKSYLRRADGSMMTRYLNRFPQGATARCSPFDRIEVWYPSIAVLTRLYRGPTQVGDLIFSFVFRSVESSVCWGYIVCLSEWYDGPQRTNLMPWLPRYCAVTVPALEA